MDLLLTHIALDDTIEYDFDITRGILLQFDAFITEDLLIQRIKSVFNFYVNIKKHFPRSLVSFINMWILLRWKEDFFKNFEMLKEMRSLYMNIMKFPEVKDDKELKLPEMIELLETDSEEEADYLLQKIKDRKKSKNISIRVETLLPFKPSEYFDILVWPEMEIARQISLYTHYYFSQIEIEEILSTRWTKKTNYINSPNVMILIERQTKLILWVCEEILSYDKSRIRAQVWEKFLKIAQNCKKLYNFNDCFIIISALNSLPLKHLDKTKSKLSSEGLRLFLELTNFISCENNFKTLRDETSKAKGNPYIPYFGLYLKELAYIEEGPKYMKNGLINIVKIKRVKVILEEFLDFKSNAYLFKVTTDLTFLSKPNPKQEEQLVELSNKLGNLIYN